MLRRSVPRAPALAAVSAFFGRELDVCMHRIETTIAEARARGARLVVFPESALGGYLYEAKAGSPSPPVAPPPALPPHAEVWNRLARVAGDTVVCVGYTESAPGGPYSSAMCLTATACSATTVRCTSRRLRPA